MTTQQLLPRSHALIVLNRRGTSRTTDACHLHVWFQEITPTVVNSVVHALVFVMGAIIVAHSKCLVTARFLMERCVLVTIVVIDETGQFRLHIVSHLPKHLLKCEDFLLALNLPLVVFNVP